MLDPWHSKLIAQIQRWGMSGPRKFILGYSRLGHAWLEACPCLIHWLQFWNNTSCIISHVVVFFFLYPWSSNSCLVFNFFYKILFWFVFAPPFPSLLSRESSRVHWLSEAEASTVESWMLVQQQMASLPWDWCLCQQYRWKVMPLRAVPEEMAMKT